MQEKEAITGRIDMKNFVIHNIKEGAKGREKTGTGFPRGFM